MTLESTTRKNVLKILRKAGLDARPVENLCDTGYPDVEYIGGTLELKAADAWPKREATPLRIDHYTTEQRVWHERRSAKGGRIHVLLQVGREFLLFHGVDAAARLGHVPRAELVAMSVAHWADLTALRTSLPIILLASCPK